MDEMIKKTMENLQKNNMPAFYAETKESAVKKVLELVPEGSSIGFGGSVTLHKLNILEELKKKNCKIKDWVNASSAEERNKLRNENILVDVYLSSTNALTEKGELVNVDGRGNRVAAITYGPKKVIIVAGKNKIVQNVDEGIERIKNIAAPLNAKRLNKKTPCVETGKCMDCNSPDRICCTTVIHGWQYPLRDLNVIIVNEDLGY